jgi:GT2 family glycosyltransferase
MRLSVIIPNYNGERLLTQLLPQLLHSLDSSGIQSEVIVADDVSSDASVPLLRANFPSVKVVEGRVNLGFGGNCNRGAAAAQGEYLAFVNSDIALDGEPFTALLAMMGAEPEAFAAMPIIYAESLQRVENAQEVWLSRGLPWLRPLPGLPVENVDSARTALIGRVLEVPLCGAFFVCRKSNFAELGGFSPSFGKAYWEDVDLGFRAHRRGWKTLLCPQAAVRHLHSQTMNQVLGEAGKRKRLLRNQALFLARNLSQLKPVPRFRLYLLMRIPQRIRTGDWGTLLPYLSLIFGPGR